MHMGGRSAPVTTLECMRGSRVLWRGETTPAAIP
jgi:hypothetical protein